MQEQGLPDGLMIQCTGFLPLGKCIYTPIDRSSNQPVVNRKNEGRHPKRITATVKSLLEAQLMGFYFFCITFITQ